MEFTRIKNVDTRIVFPIMKNDGTFITGAAGLDSEYALTGAHGGVAPSFSDCTHEATEIASTGLYYLDVQAAEINDDYATIQVKSSTTGAITQVILIKTKPSDVNTVSVSGTAQTARDIGLSVLLAADQEVNVTKWKGATAPAMTGDAYALIGATGSGLTSLAPASTALSNAVWTDTKAGYLTGDAFLRIGAAGAGLTALGDTRLAHLDADVSTRSTFAGGTVASVTGSVGSVTAGVTVSTNNDKGGYSLTVTPPTAGDIKTAIEAAGSTLATIATAVGALSPNTDEEIDITEIKEGD